MSIKLLTHYRRKYRLNERFFDKWSCEMAYVLGFWFADGYMRKEKSYRITFTTIDKLNLLQIRRALSSSQPLRGKRDKNSGSFTWDLTVYSKDLYEQLQRLGGLRAKSKTIQFPSIPSQYLPDFIRGYFDGDGSVFFVTYTRTKDGKTARELRTNFTSGSRQFLTDLMHTLNSELNLSIKKLGVYGNDSSFKLGYGMKDSDALLRYMYYENFSIGLERKAKFIFQIPKYQTHTMSR